MVDYLKGENVIMREMEEKDWIDVHEYASQPAVCRYQPWGPNNEEESELFVKQVIKDAKNNPRTRFVFAVFLKGNGKMIGSGEFNIRDYSNKAGEIGYIINPGYWGMGYATEVAKLLIGFGFENLNLHRIYATCDPRNIGSSKVLEKIGMAKEGRMREDLLIKDGWRDSLLYSILVQEWSGK
ncbi:GNAT family N-acetyltransferase [Sporosarcina sp. ANT_H38]|uniref:GNAT family N-acetyltransferase n=1 Tax=Sporosarcina sp. ANT_H38 TaxID=2597358 RepID=UPI0011F31821|nr:GNAT family protein [Sporosarcina sp. ANT_H38]KAA0965970.1 GNAT family N-acetyltransferase [Sporosarcina sp. ANT_H38]